MKSFQGHSALHIKCENMEPEYNSTMTRHNYHSKVGQGNRSRATRLSQSFGGPFAVCWTCWTDCSGKWPVNSAFPVTQLSLSSKLIRARGPASGWIPIIEDHERRSFVSYRSRAVRIMTFDMPAIENTYHQLSIFTRCVAQHAIQFHVVMLYTLPLGLSVTFVSPSHLLTARVAP